MKKLLSLVMLLAATLFIVSCSEDDKDPTPVDPDIKGEAVSSNITSDVTWTTGNQYTLTGRIAVESGATLTIEPGVVIYGQAGTGANATALLVARGGTLNAQGTASSPIIFTSIADQIEPGEIVSPNLTSDINGLWGGVIILGDAPISASNDDGDLTEVQIEGIPSSDPNGLYGGSNPAHNIGTISYISIRHGGANIGEGNEINGLTLGGVGSGSSISWVSVVANQDDGIEWFGGLADINGILIWNCGDDGLDTDQDWQGTASNFAIVTPAGGSAFELDGPEGSAKVNGANGFHTFNNGAVYAGDDIDHIVDWDGSTNAALTNIHFFGLDAEYLDDFANTTPIESFGGDASGTSSNWDVEWPAEATSTVAEAFGADAAAITTTVTSKSKGPSAADFSWTLAGASGALSSIGL